MRQAGLRAVISEYNQYNTAITTFYGTYNFLPGDLSNAYAYWGANCSGSAATCNGNGNRKINTNGTGAGDGFTGV